MLVYFRTAHAHTHTGEYTNAYFDRTDKRKKETIHSGRQISIQPDR